MTIIASTPAEVNVYVATVLKSAIKLYAATKMQVNRAYTPTRMLAKASEITGKKFKRGQFEQARVALELWIAEQQQG